MIMTEELAAELLRRELETEDVEVLGNRYYSLRARMWDKGS